MTKKATGHDADGNAVSFWYEGNLTIEQVGPEEEHEITLIDTNNVSTVVPFIGGRPDDR